MEELIIQSWSEFKTLAISKQLGIQYLERTSYYDIYINEGVLIWKITLYKDGESDVKDFETTYKSLSNKPSYFLGQFRNKYKNITGNTTTTIKSSGGVLRAISINDSNTNGSFTIYDNKDASGTIIGSFQIGSPSGGLISTTGKHAPTILQLTIEFTTGLTIVTSGSSNNDITAIYV